MINRLTVIALGVGLAACGIQEDDEVGEIVQALKKCTDTDVCGANSPVVKIYGTYGFNLDGDKNNEGFSLLGMSLGNDWFELDVRDSHIVGLDRHKRVVLEGEKLIGATIWFALGRSRSQFGIEITGVGQISEVVDKPLMLETYVLKWGEAFTNLLPLGQIVPAGSVYEHPIISGDTTYVCSSTPVPPSVNWGWNAADAEWDESWSMTKETKENTPYHSLVFEGDRIYSWTRTIDPTPNPRWFNIGCARHTLAKLRLTRNTILTSSWERAQTTLKMFAADYCGVAAFTAPGQPLVWRDGVGIDYLKNPKTLEARWNENGAMCLDKPRLYSLQEIETECKAGGSSLPPPCKDSSWSNWENEINTSGNP